MCFVLSSLRFRTAGASRRQLRTCKLRSVHTHLHSLIVKDALIYVYFSRNMYWPIKLANIGESTAIKKI